MNPDDISVAILFLAVVALMIFVGVAVGMIVAGRLDKLMTPRPPRPPEGPIAPATEPEEEQS